MPLGHRRLAEPTAPMEQEALDGARLDMLAPLMGDEPRRLAEDARVALAREIALDPAGGPGPGSATNVPNCFASRAQS